MIKHETNAGQGREPYVYAEERLLFKSHAGLCQRSIIRCPRLPVKAYIDKKSTLEKLPEKR